MALTKAQKQKIIEGLREKIEKQKAIAIIDIGGIKVKDLSRLRKLMMEKDCELKVAKKTLMKIAFKEKGIEVDVKRLEGEVALGFGYKDGISPFKIVYEFSKTAENLKILGGIVEGKIINKEKAIVFATLPTREELLAKLVGSISAPVSGLVNVLQAPLEALIFAIKAFGEKQSSK